jgi:hypothetical protein
MPPPTSEMAARTEYVVTLKANRSCSWIRFALSVPVTSVLEAVLIPDGLWRVLLELAMEKNEDISRFIFCEARPVNPIRPELRL